MLFFTILLTAFVVGYASTKIVNRLLNSLKIEINLEPYNFVEQFFLYYSLGFVFIIMYSLLLSFFKKLDQIGSLIILVGASVITIMYLTATLMKKRPDLKLLKKINPIQGLKEGILSIIFIVIVFTSFHWFFDPVIAKNLAVYPGGDDKIYIFVTKQIIEHKTAITLIDYPYAQEYVHHILMAAFMAIAAFYSNLLNTIGISVSLPLLHLFLAVFYFSMSPISMYIYTKQLTKNTEFSIITGIVSIFMWRSLLRYLYWGGEGEALGYYLVPLLAIIDYKLNEFLIKRDIRARDLRLIVLTIVKLILIAEAAYIHIYTLILYIFIALIINPVATILNMRHVKLDLVEVVKKYFHVILPYLIILTIIPLSVISAYHILPILGMNNEIIELAYNELMRWDQNEILNDYFQQKWTKNWLVLRNGFGINYAISKLNSILEQFHGAWIQTFILLTIAYILLWKLKSRKEHATNERDGALEITTIMMITALLFFLFTQNSPFGWYYIPYPLAKRILTVRLYYEWSVFLLYAISLPVYLTWIILRSRIQQVMRHGIIEIEARVLWKKITRQKTKTILTIATITALLLSIPSIHTSYIIYKSSTNQAVITPNDLKAFEWIKENTTTNDIFFVNPADAGPYIYIYTGRIILPTYALRAWTQPENLQDFKLMVTMFQKGILNSTLYDLLRKYNITYIYIGEKTQYNQPQYNIMRLLISPKFKIAYKTGKVYIFEVEL